MAASSERKIEANRRNARKSTGPKSAEGKQKSRRNGWKHGLAAVVVVPADETEALDRAIAGWSEQLRPENVAEASLVHQMAAADVRMRRCAQVNETAMEGDAIAAVRRWEEKRRHRVRRRAQDLKDDAANVVADLEGSSFGCDWLIRRWRHLDSGLRLGLCWGPENLHEATRLLGYVAINAPAAIGEPAAIRLWTLAIRAGGTAIRPPAYFVPDPTAPEDWKQVQAELRRFIAAQIERLEGLREEAWEAVDGPEAEAVASKALMDAGKEAQVRHRYYRDAQLAQQRALRQLAAIREHRRKAEAEAPRGVTGAAILEAICVQELARAKAEAAAPDAPGSRRTEPNEAADRAEGDRQKPLQTNRLENRGTAEQGVHRERTEPRPGAGSGAPERPESGDRPGSTGRESRPWAR